MCSIPQEFSDITNGEEYLKSVEVEDNIKIVPEETDDLYKLRSLSLYSVLSSRDTPSPFGPYVFLSTLFSFKFLCDLSPTRLMLVQNNW
jgi:hypothetical protein